MRYRRRPAAREEIMALGPVRVRKDVWRLAAGDKTLEWYGKAIAEMKKRPIADPASWRYQAAIHGYLRDMDPYAAAGDVLPSAGDQGKFWNQCQHSSWFFIPWHRGYLLQFEAICLGHIRRLGGPADWALPYWNYSAVTRNARLLPTAFRSSRVGGNPNPLFVPGRNTDAGGNSGISSADVSLNCLNRTKFVGTSTGGSQGFGGPQTGFNHGGGPMGALEATPHGNVHVRIGGFMSEFETAGLDPIFWLHHCNIDRLWEVWRDRPTSLGDPTQTSWKTTKFALHDPAGTVVAFTSKEMISTTALGYRYQDVADPFAIHAATAASAEEPAMAKPPATPAPPAVLAGATDRSVSLGQKRSSARLAVAPRPPHAAMGLAAAAPRRVFLNIEHITGNGPPGIYSVYVNLPEGEDPEGHPDNFAGTLPLFGLAAASRADSPHGGSGLTHVLEITDLARRLEAEGRWNDQDLDVAFEPDQPVPEGTAVKIGRISVYYG
jgi:tyrosinase